MTWTWLLGAETRRGRAMVPSPTGAKTLEFPGAPSTEAGFPPGDCGADSAEEPREEEGPG